jgi:hypothetical protein
VSEQWHKFEWVGSIEPDRIAVLQDGIELDEPRVRWEGHIVMVLTSVPWNIQLQRVVAPLTHTTRTRKPQTHDK